MIRALYTVARIALAVVFIRSGYEVVRAPAKAAATAGPLLGAVRSQSPVPLPADEQLVQANAAAQVAGGVLLATGIAPQLAAGVLMGSLVPTTFAGHSFWKPRTRPSGSISATTSTRTSDCSAGCCWWCLPAARRAGSSKVTLRRAFGRDAGHVGT